MIEYINKAYFWDVNIANIDEEKSKRLIIERVMSLGNMEEIKQIMNRYGKEEVLNTLKRINWLDPKTLNFVSLIFHVPKSSFRCYIKMQSTPTHWNC